MSLSVLSSCGVSTQRYPSMGDLVHELVASCLPPSPGSQPPKGRDSVPSSAVSLVPEVGAARRLGDESINPTSCT